MTVPVEITVSNDGVVSISGRSDVSEDTPSPMIITEGVNINTDYSNRVGYDPEFLGKGSKKVPPPKLSAAIKAKAAINREANGGDKHLLTYYHYSLVMNRERKIAFYTATNIDGHTQHRFDLGDREGDSWIKDHRINADDQIGPELYAGNPLDKGHLTRRLDPAWGDSKKFAKMANDDTFHYTNCCPQHQRFNRNKSTWAGLEDFILNNALAKDYKATVFIGPIFKNSDPEFEGVKIPLQFWKVVALVGVGGKLSASAYRLGRADLIEDMLEEAFKPTTHQITIRKLEELTGLDFGRLSDYDAIGGEEEAFGMREIVSLADIKI